MQKTYCIFLHVILPLAQVDFFEYFSLYFSIVILYLPVCWMGIQILFLDQLKLEIMGHYAHVAMQI